MSFTQTAPKAEAPRLGRAVDEQGSSPERFLVELAQMTPEERFTAYRERFTLHEVSVYAARYPEEIPKVNGEFEWIALTLE